MKKEIPAGLIAIVAIAAIAIFVVNPSMSTSFEIDGKQTSDELELLFLGSGNDEYQEYKYVSEKIEKRRISASAGGAEVYEAGLLPEFLEKWIDKLFEFLSGTDPKELGEDLYEKVDEEYPHYDEAGEPGPTPEAGKVIGEYVGPKELIIDGELSDGEKNMLDAMGVGDIVFKDGGHRYYTADGGVAPGVKHSRIAFLGDDMYFYEKGNPKVISQVKSNKLGHITFKPLGSNYPTVSCSFNNRRGCLIESEEELFKGTDFLDSSRKFEINGELSGNEIEYVVKDIRPVIKKKIGGKVKIHTLGGEATLKLSDIPLIDADVVLSN
jgi:hypothetical protein